MGFGRDEGRGTENPTLDDNLIHQLAAMREAVLLEVFLDIQKACDALDQERALEIFAAYGVGPRTVLLLWTY